jgi:type I restriction enzyme S subunit
MLNVPSGWAWIRLNDLGRFTGGATPSTNDSLYWGGDVFWVSPKDMKNGRVYGSELRITDKALKETRLELIPRKSILIVGRSGILRRLLPVAINEVECTVNQDLKVIIPFVDGIAEYAQLMLKGFEDFILTELVKGGMTVQSLKYSEFEQQAFPLPPLEEQKRIVAKVNDLMRLCDELEARQLQRRKSRVRLNNVTLAPLNNAASLAQAEFEQAATRLADNFAALYDSAETVGKLRSTILQLAVQGNLVPQDPRDKPASVLLKRIEAAREGNEAKHRKKKIEYSSISVSNSPFPIPSTWLWTRLVQLSQLIEYGTSEKASPDNKGVPILRMNNIEGGKVLHSNLKYVSSNIKDLPRLYLETDELLFNRTNSFDLVGKTGIFKGEGGKYTFASYLIRIRLFNSCTFPDYVNLAMNAAYFRETQINTEVTQQCGQANFNGTKLAHTLIPLPPLEEQKRIVAKVNQLMALCDELEAKLRHTEADGERLMKAAVRQLLESVSHNKKDEAVLSAV